MRTESVQQERRFGLSAAELAHWNENGYLVRLNVFSPEENDVLRQVAEDVVDGKRPYPSTNINQNALVRDEKIEAQGIHAMHKNPSSELLLSRIPLPCTRSASHRPTR